MLQDADIQKKERPSCLLVGGWVPKASKSRALQLYLHHPCDQTIQVTKKIFFTPVIKPFMLRKHEKCFPTTKFTKINQNLVCGQRKRKIEIPSKRFTHVTHPHTMKHLKNSTYQPVTLPVKSNLKSIER